MRPRFYLVFVVLYCTAFLLFAVSLRNSRNHIFYKLRKMVIEQNRLKQKLWQKQLQLEGLINPAAVSEFLKDQAREQKYQD